MITSPGLVSGDLIAVLAIRLWGPLLIPVRLSCNWWVGHLVRAVSSVLHKSDRSVLFESRR
jgi:hypothetical protein